MSRPLALARFPQPLFGLALASAALLLAAFSPYMPAHAQESGVSISQLDCAGDPEVVTIANGGSDSQDLSEWTLVSDPVAAESFALTDVGALAAGASVNVQSGPSASGTLVWSTDEIFRDDDPSDFARLIDAAGATVDEIACAEATPTPSPSPTPEPTTPADDVPNGGGPPASGSGPLLTPLVLAGAGVSSAALTLIVFALAPLTALRRVLSVLQPRRRAHAKVSSIAEPGAAPGSLSLLIVGLIAALLMLLATIAVGVRRRS